MEIEYLEIYNSFLTELSQLNLADTEIIDTLIKDDNTKKFNNGNQLVLAINTTVNFNNLLNSKIKLFSHKNPDTLQISESLFGKNLSLKKVFNNQSDEIKNKLWFYIHKIVLLTYKINLIENNDEKNKDKINKLEILINNYQKESINSSIKDTKSYIDKIINNKNLNESTNEMIDDIVKSFENVFKSGETNPFQNIMQINELITDKYKDKIESGEVDLNQIMESLQKSVPGLGDINGISELLSSFTASKEPKETIIMDENFSTADIPQGTLESDKPDLIVNNVLKTVDSLGAGIKNNGESTNTSGPDLSKLMGIFNKLGSLQEANPQDIQNIFENDLGLDMNKLTEQMTKVLQS